MGPSEAAQDGREAVVATGKTRLPDIHDGDISRAQHGDFALQKLLNLLQKRIFLLPPRTVMSSCH